MSRMLASLSLLVAVPALAQTAPMRHVRGTVQSLAGSTLTIEAPDGQSTAVKLAPNWSVTGVRPITLDAIKPGSYIGAVAVGPASHQTATEVHVLPEAARGAGEGQSPWDMPQATMTNGTVEAEATSTSGRVLTMSLKGKTVEMTVPENVPIVTFVPGSQSLVVPGAKVFISASVGADGALTASRVQVGEQGIAPPL